MVYCMYKNTLKFDNFPSELFCILEGVGYMG